MNRIPYLNDMINFFKNDANIIAAGLDKTILVYSEWTIDKLSKNWEYGIIIQPGSGTPITSTDRRSGCKGMFDWDVMIGVQVSNVYATQQHFEIDETAPNWSLVGAYPQAAELEGIVRKSMEDFNAAIVAAPKKYDPFVLIEAQEPEELNGFLMLRQLYKTRFIF